MKTQVPIAWPLQTSPVHPRKLLPVAVVGVSVTDVPVKTSSKQSPPQLKHAPVTAPLPTFTTRTPVRPRKSAVVLVLAMRVNAHVAFVRPPHGPPLQLRK